MAGQIDLRTGPAAAGPLIGSSITCPSSPMSSTGTTTSMSSGLRMPASTIVTGRGARRFEPIFALAEAAEEAGDLLQWPLGRGQADALRRLLATSLQPFEREGEMGAALGGRRARGSRR